MRQHPLGRFAVRLGLVAIGVLALALTSLMRSTEEADPISHQEAPASALNPNEPDGFTMLTNHPFDQFAPAGWKHTDPARKLSLVTDEIGAPHSPPGAARRTYTNGEAGGSGNFQEEYLGFSKSQLYVNMALKVSSRFRGHSSRQNKLGFIAEGSGNTLVPSLRGSGSETLRVNVTKQNFGTTPTNAHYSCDHPDNQLGNRCAQAAFSLDAWHSFEIWIVWNDNGDRSGQIHYWLNGVKVGQFTGLQLDDDTRAMGRFTWYPIWGGNGGSADREFYMWVDNIYLSSN